jgi:hypothetical protein
MKNTRDIACNVWRATTKSPSAVLGLRGAANLRWWLFGAIIWQLAACTPFDTKLDRWVGHPIQEWVALTKNGNERIEEIRGPDAAGNTVYVTFVSSKCTVFWTVDQQGIMSSWKHEGSDCKHYWQ